MKTSLFSSHVPAKSAPLTSNTYSQTSIPNLTPNPHFKLTTLPALTPNLTLEPHLSTWNFEDSLPEYHPLKAFTFRGRGFSLFLPRYQLYDNDNNKDLYKLFTTKITSRTASKSHSFLCLVNIWLHVSIQHCDAQYCICNL